jgi:TolB protein
MYPRRLHHPVVLGFNIALILSLWLVAASPAGATYPGLNGKIVFVSTHDGGDTDVFTINPDGTGLTQLTADVTEDRNPAWSADGKKIAWTSYAGGDAEIWTMNADGTGKTQLTSNASDEGSAAWSPDGKKIAFNSIMDGDWDVYVMNANGSGVTPLTINSTFDCCASWSPDGTKIAFQPAPGGTPNYDIYTMNPDGTGQSPLVATGYYEVGPDWAPSGATVLFARDFGFGAGWAEVMRVNSDGTAVTNLTNTATIWESDAAYSPDGTKIVFISNEADPSFDVYVMNADGTGRVLLFGGGGTQSDADWQCAKARTACRGRVGR